MPLDDIFRRIDVGIGFILRNGLIEELAKGLISTIWFELKKLFLWYNSSYIVVMIAKGLGKLLTVIAIAIGPYIYDIAQELPVGPHGNLRRD